MALTWLDDHLSIAHLLDLAGKESAEILTDIRFDAACAAIGDDAVVVQSAEIRASCDVASLEVNTEAERFNHTAADLKFKRIVSEESKVSWTASRGDAGRHGGHP